MARLFADSTQALEFQEQAYPPRYYFSREDLKMDLLSVSEIPSIAPLKRHAACFSLGEIQDIAWNYEYSIEDYGGYSGKGGFLLVN